MRRTRALIISVSLLLFFSAAHAENVENDNTHSYPVEMLYKGKPIDPICAYIAMRDRVGKGVNLSTDCRDFFEDGFSAQKQTLVITSKGAGYDFEYEGGNSGGFYYEVVGETPDGIILNINYSMGGSGHFSNLGIYTRNGDTLRKLRNIAGGDRCAGGIREAKIEDGHLLYVYYVTPLELYQKYTPNAQYRSDLGSGFANCGALIYMKDEKTKSIELVENAIIPDCFIEEYIKQVATKKTISDIEAKELVKKFSEACPLTEKLK